MTNKRKIIQTSILIIICITIILMYFKHANTTQKLSNVNSVSLYLSGFGLDEIESSDSMYQQITDLLSKREAFHDELLSTTFNYIDKQSQAYEYYDFQYYPLDYQGVTDWSFFESKALEIYSDSYVKNILNAYYVDSEHALFVQHDGMLYRYEGDDWATCIDYTNMKIFRLNDNYIEVISPIVSDTTEYYIATISCEQDTFLIENEYYVGVSAD